MNLQDCAQSVALYYAGEFPHAGVESKLQLQKAALGLYAAVGQLAAIALLPADSVGYREMLGNCAGISFSALSVLCDRFGQPLPDPAALAVQSENETTSRLLALASVAGALVTGVAALTLDDDASARDEFPQFLQIVTTLLADFVAAHGGTLEEVSATHLAWLRRNFPEVENAVAPKSFFTSGTATRQ